MKERILKTLEEHLLLNRGVMEPEEIKDLEEQIEAVKNHFGCFNNKKKYYVSYRGSTVVEAEDESEACELALDEISIDEIDAYEIYEDRGLLDSVRTRLLWREIHE